MRVAFVVLLTCLVNGAAGSNVEGEAFLAENAQKEGVVVLASGLQYKILASGPEGGRRYEENRPGARPCEP